jgi:hypothetical protein
LATNKIRVIPEGERETDPGAGSGPDAEDLMVLKRKVVLSSPKNAVGGRPSRSGGAKVWRQSIISLKWTPTIELHSLS